MPKHLVDASHLRPKHHGLGAGDRYPHDYEGADVEQQYLPDKLADRRYDDPTEEGRESCIRARIDELVARRGQGSHRRR